MSQVMMADRFRASLAAPAISCATLTGRLPATEAVTVTLVTSPISVMVTGLRERTGGTVRMSCPPPRGKYPRHLEVKVGPELVEVAPEDGDVVADGRRHLGVGAAAQVQPRFLVGEEQAGERGLRQEADGAGRPRVRLVPPAPEGLPRCEVDL